MHPFELMSQPIRRRIVEVLASGEHTAGTLEQLIHVEFGVTRSTVGHHIAVLMRNGWLDVRSEGTEHHYKLEDDVIEQLESIGVGSLTVVLLTGVFTGAVLALQSGLTLDQFGARPIVGRLVSASLGSARKQPMLRPRTVPGST